MTGSEDTTGISRFPYKSTEFADPETIRTEAEQKAQSIQQPDVSSMTLEEIKQQFHELHVKQLEAGLQNEQLRSLLEAYKDRENELHHQVMLQDSLMNNIPDIVFIKDTQGVYLACNSEFVRHVGLRREDIIGKTDYDLYSRADAEFFRENDLLMLEQGSPRRNEEWISCPDGRKILLDTTKTPYRDSDGSVIGVIAICRDITRLRQAEKQIDTEARLRSILLDNVPNCIALILKKHTREIVASNKAAAAIGAVPGKTCFGVCAERGDSCPFCLAPELWATNKSHWKKR